MADFCAQCSVENFGEDFHDLAKLTPPGTFAFALCEDCGIAIVTHWGDCRGQCDKNHGPVNHKALADKLDIAEPVEFSDFFEIVEEKPAWYKLKWLSFLRKQKKIKVFDFFC